MRQSLKKLCFVIPFILTYASAQSSISRSAENYEKASQKLESAVKSQNFKAARSSLNELMPLIKEEIKESKKEVLAEKKAKNKEAVKELTAKLDRKTEIYDMLDHIIHASPAALRVEAKKAINLVNEFVKLSEWPKTT